MVVDETMDGFKEHFSSKKYMLVKSIMQKITQCIANSNNGYLLKCLGKRSGEVKIIMGEQAVIDTSEDYAGKYHHTHFNFSSPTKLI